MPLHPTTATINESSPRAADWVTIFGDGTIPLQSPVPHKAHAPDGSICDFYKVDVSRMNALQIMAAVEIISKKFRVPTDEVHAGILGEHGIPILAEDVSTMFDGRLVL